MAIFVVVLVLVVRGNGRDRKEGRSGGEQSRNVMRLYRQQPWQSRVNPFSQVN
jgi:hypothetical protein